MKLQATGRFGIQFWGRRLFNFPFLLLQVDVLPIFAFYFLFFSVDKLIVIVYVVGFKVEAIYNLFLLHTDSIKSKVTSRILVTPSSNDVA